MVELPPRTVLELDRVDRQILEELQRDGRVSVAELARRVHLSATPCQERMRRLEREGFIKDYVARLDARRLGFDILVFVEVLLDRSNPDLFERFRIAIRDIDEVTECYMVAGNFQYLLKVRANSMAAYQRFLVEKLICVEGLQQTHTTFALDEIKLSTRLPISPPHPPRAKRRRR
jgi:Lrp/AsnC family leucine-responsive transcriptional regulator